MTSIIIPVRYRADLTRVCIDSVIGYTNDYELILVQEGEDKEITELLMAYPAKFIQNKEPMGFAGAMNTGMKLATGDHYCFLNNDTVVTPHWLEKMLKGFENTSVGLVAPTLSGINNRQSIDWNFPKNDPLYREFEELLGEYRMFAVIGVCFLIPKKVMDEVGKWDESFMDTANGVFGGGEDYDLTIRIDKAGYLLAVARDVFIYHYWGASFKELFENDLGRARANAATQFEKVEKKHNIKIL